MSKKKSHYRKADLVFEELESRLLLSADPLAVATDAGTAAVEELVLDNYEDHSALVQTTTEQAISSVRTELVIIDSRAPNYQQLYNDLIKAQQQGRNIHVVVLDAHRDGIEQINEVFANYDKLDAVHIVSHGDDGQLQLGSTQLNKTTLRDHASDIGQWKDRFTDDGDLLIYGCNLAETAEGETMVDALSYLTATDVAASDDLTGNKLLGGDWELEYEAGEIESTVAFSEDVQQNWQGTLEGAAAAGAEQEKAPAEAQQQEQQAQLELSEQQAVINEEEQAAISKEQEQQAEIAEEQRQDVVFIDESVSDFQAFIDDLQANSNGPTTFEIILLDSDRNGIDQINETLSSYNDVNALHIISHGYDGTVKLGNTWLSVDNIEQHSDSLSAWNNSLTQEADILIYGCKLAESMQGEQFVAELSQLTGADVAASNDITGHASLGGDWDLEYKAGVVETEVAFTEDVRQSWASILNTFVVTSTADSGVGSLRQAILDANSNVNGGTPDLITFNIAGGGPHIVNLTSALPAITEAVVIDGTTEPDFSYTGDGSPRPVVVIDGTVAGAVDGIVLDAGSDGSEIRGLVIQNFQNDGILVQSDSNTIAGNILGLQADGDTIAGNNLVGTSMHGNIRVESANNIIGGLTPAERNILSGSGFDGIALIGAGATGNQVIGNYIGTDITGTLARGNAQEGIEIDAANGNIIGGAVAGARNIISGNGSDGMEIDSADNNIIQGNYIGTDYTGTLDVGNVRDGIDLNENTGDGATGNLIGGTDPNAGNLISGNDMFGIEVRDAPTNSNTILGNRIYNNGLIGIQLGADGVVTVNDLGDADADANNLQNFPVLTSADTNTVDTIAIDGTINSTASSYFRIEFFASSVADGTGYGEGENYLGYVNVATDAGGNASFSAALSATVANGAVISATATRSDATYTTFTDTSEFAANINAVANYSAGATNDPQAYSNYLTSLGPTGYWRLGEAGGGTAVDQTGLNDGVYNGATLGQTGAIAADVDSALQFDGLDDYVELAHDPAYLLDDGTVQFWFNTADVTQRADLFSKDALGNVTGGHLSVYLDGLGNIETRLQSASASYLVTSTLPLTNNQWHHVAFTFGTDGMQLYVDGQWQDSDAYTGGLGTTSGGAGNFEPIAIGASTQVSGAGLVTPLQDYFTGTMDEVALFGTALSADQIQNLFAGGLQNYTVAEDNTLNVSAAEGVLINDYDQEGDPLTAVLVSGPSNAASFTLNPDGSYDYTPVANFSGTDTFTYRANDGTSNSNVSTVTITITAENDAPVDLQVTATTQGGISLNEDGGNDVYFVADNGAGLLGGLTTVTIEASFSVTTPGADLTPLLSYADGANDEELALFLKSDGRIWFGTHSNGSPIQSTTGNFTQLFDGEVHHVAASWDSSTGAVVFYVDGQQVESFSGYQTGQTITGGGELVFGQDQDSVLGGFKVIDVFSGSLYDVRIFNDVRTPVEIAASYDQTLPNTEPGIIANWLFNDMSTGGIIMDNVSGNNLTEQHVVGVGFSSSTPELSLVVREDAANGTVIGSITAIDPDSGDTFTYTLLDDAGGRFAINAGDGQLTLANASMIDYEAASTHNITVRVTDSGALTYDEVFTVNVLNVNEAPLNTVPATQVVLEDTQTAIAGISVADPDAGVNVITTQLSVSSGVLDITLAGAASISAGANGSNTFTLSGNVTDINASLASLQYTGNANVNGIAADSLSIVTNDLGNVGAGGAQSDSDSVQIDITAVNDVPNARDDRIGLLFDGVDDYVTIGDYAGLNVTTNVTMEAWVKPTGLGTGSKIIINKEGEYELAINATTGELMWAFDNIDPDWSWHYTGYFVQAGEWTHLAVSYNNGVVDTFANGVLVDSYNGSGAITDNYPAFNQLQIGGRENAVTQRFDGYIDEVRIWNTTRTQLDIQTNMNTLLTGAEPGLIGNWRFDEGSGITVEDQSVFAHHGTLADGVTVGEMPAWQGYVVSEEGTLSVSAANGVLANDYDIDGDALIAVLVTGPTNAAAFSLNPDGSFTYTPAANFNGVDTFTYRANDGSVDSNVATVTIRVDPVNDVPVAIASTVSTTEDNAYSFSTVDFTYFDTEGDALVSATLTNLTLAGGTLTHSGGTTVNSGDTLTAAQLNTLVYTPLANATGTPLATFDFSVNDTGAGVTTAQMSINVTVVNDVPEAIASTVSTTEDNAYSFSTVDFTYFDTEGDALVSATISNLSLAGGTLTHSSGTTVNNGDTLTAAQLNTLVYTPSANANGTPLATFDFSVNDAGIGTVSAQMSINVTALPDAAVIGGVDSGAVTEDDDPDTNNLLEVSGALSIIDPDAGEAVFNAGAIGGTYGVITLNAAGGWNYAAINNQPAVQNLAAGATLTDTITISSVDGTTHDIVITIMGTNDAPVAGNDVASVNEGGSVLIAVAANDSDIDNALDLNSIIITGLPSSGSVVVNGDGTLTYTHDGSETLVDSISYTISDISGAISNTATVTLSINPVNDAPTTSGIADVSVNEDAASTNIDLNAAFSDSDNLDSELTYSILGNNNIGLFAATGIDNTTGQLTLDYAADMNGAAQISIRASDPSGSFVDTLFSVNVAPVNDNPMLQANTGVLMTGTEPATISSAELNVTDIDNLDSELLYTITELPAHGDLMRNGLVMAVNDTFTQAELDSNLVVYTPKAAVVADRFGFTVSDNAGGALANNTFNIIVQLNQGNDDGSESEPPPGDTQEEEDTREEDTGNTDSGGSTADAGGFGGGYEPFGSTSAPPPATPAPVLTIDPTPQPVPEQETPVEPEEEHTAVEIEQHEVSTFAAVQVKSIDALWSAIDKMKQEMADSADENTETIEFQVAAAKSSGVVLTAGVVAWILRSGALLSSLLSTIPLWKGYDPLPILAYKDDDKDKNKEEEIDEHTIPTSLEELRKLKKLMQQKQKTAKEVDVDSMFGDSTIRE